MTDLKSRTILQWVPLTPGAPLYIKSSAAVATIVGTRAAGSLKLPSKCLRCWKRLPLVVVVVVVVVAVAAVISSRVVVFGLPEGVFFVLRLCDGDQVKNQSVSVSCLVLSCLPVLFCFVLARWVGGWMGVVRRVPNAWPYVRPGRDNGDV